MNVFFENIELTKQIILYTTLLSNNASNSWEEDCGKIIDFICSAYNSNNLVDDYKRLISYDISNLSMINETKLIFNKKEYNDDFSDLEILYDIKSRSMIIIKMLSERLKTYNIGLFTNFDYSNIIPYNSVDRRNSILKASCFGDVELSVMSGLLFATGIGGNNNLRLAKLRFLQAAFWGYFPAFIYASKVSQLLGDEEDSSFYGELYSACSKFLTQGVTMIPQSLNDKYSKKTREYFSLISSIYFDVVVLYKLSNIVFSFVEVMLIDELSINEKMNYVNHYNEYKWKDETNFVKGKTLNKFGFNI